MRTHVAKRTALINIHRTCESDNEMVVGVSGKTTTMMMMTMTMMVVVNELDKVLKPEESSQGRAPRVWGTTSAHAEAEVWEGTTEGKSHNAPRMCTADPH